MKVHFSIVKENGEIVHHAELSEGDLYLLGFALNDLRKHTTSPQIEAGASEMLRVVQEMEGKG